MNAERVKVSFGMSFVDNTGFRNCKRAFFLDSVMKLKTFLVCHLQMNTITMRFITQMQECLPSSSKENSTFSKG